ncbi:MAG TPA: UvrD-helicase domain-containing protein [Galbitalea sp.]|nr:UvrD-helicase domain-containing protein [Galbitalea sp.]
MLYRLLDEARDRAERGLTRTLGSGGAGGTFQARVERDFTAAEQSRRLAQLNAVEHGLCFGRTDSEPTPDRVGTLYIGRIGLRDDEHEPRLIDWRAPAAHPFYAATPSDPNGLIRRRHIYTRNRTVTGVDDEVFDLDRLSEPDRRTLSGEAMLIASITSRRTGRMSDVVATIQAEQDRVIRSALQGVLVVQGGPGTGKTAVALHRAAYLLYSHRDRLRSSGVLIVGPSPSFLEYIEAVLPSLGETGVVLASVGQLFPGVETTFEDAPEVAALKGRAAMADLISRAVKSRQVIPAEPQVLDVLGEKITLEPSVVQSAMQAAQRTRKPHNVARQQFQKSVLGTLTTQLAAQLRSHGSTIDDVDLGWLREDVRNSYDVRVALNTAWLPLTPEKFLQDLYARPNWLASLTPNWSVAERELLRRDRGAPFTLSDVPLLDEAAELLGEYDTTNDSQKREEKAQFKRDVKNAEQAIKNMGVEGLVNAEDLAANFTETTAHGTTAERAAADREWTYGHIVVDEAQELSPMQWRLLRRRCPLRSFTIVGDVAQASAAAAAPDWTIALTALTTEFRLEELTVNYRTPAQITDAAEEMALDHGLSVTKSRAVRESEWPVDEVVVEVGDLLAAVVDVVDEDRQLDDRGTLAVIAPARIVDALAQELTQRFGASVGRAALGLRRAIAVLTPQEAKGLEFDSVVVTEANEIIESSSRGVGALYVAMTRPTQRLHLVGTSALA